MGNLILFPNFRTSNDNCDVLVPFPALYDRNKISVFFFFSHSLYLCEMASAEDYDVVFLHCYVPLIYRSHAVQNLLIKKAEKEVEMVVFMTVSLAHCLISFPLSSWGCWHLLWTRLGPDDRLSLQPDGRFFSKLSFCDSTPAPATISYSFLKSGRLE